MDTIFKDKNGYIHGLNGNNIDKLIIKFHHIMMINCENEYYHLPINILESIDNNWYKDENDNLQYVNDSYKLEKIEDFLHKMHELYDTINNDDYIQLLKEFSKKYK